jgi:choline-sulfatase
MRVRSGAERERRGVDRRPDIVLFLTDEQRFDWTGTTSGGFFETPFLDSLAADGVRFDTAYSSAPTCVPSRTALFTGLHHLRVPTVAGGRALREGVWTVARALRDSGYETAAFGRMHFEPMHADHGFETLRICENINEGSGYGPGDIDDYARFMADEGLPDWRIWERDRSGALVPHLAGTPRVFPADADHHSTGWIADEACRFLSSRRGDRPLFLVVSFPHPHAPYDPPEPYASMYDPAEAQVPTDGFEVNAFLLHAFRNSWGKFGRFATPLLRVPSPEGDEHFRRILTAIRGLVRHIDDAIAQVASHLDLDSSAVFFTSDHGDYGGHRGLYTKVPWIPFDDLLRVPLIVSGGAVANHGAIVSECVETGGFTATCLDLAGVEPPDADGDFRSLMPFLSGAGDANWSDGPVFAALSSGFPTVRVGPYKLITCWTEPEHLLFDLLHDPGERWSLHDLPTSAELLDLAFALLEIQMTKPAPARDAQLVEVEPTTT